MLILRAKETHPEADVAKIGAPLPEQAHAEPHGCRTFHYRFIGPSFAETEDVEGHFALSCISDDATDLPWAPACFAADIEHAMARQTRGSYASEPAAVRRREVAARAWLASCRRCPSAGCTRT